MNPRVRSIAFYQEVGQSVGWPESLTLVRATPVKQPEAELDVIVFPGIAETSTDVIDEQRPQDSAVFAAHEATIHIENKGMGATSGNWTLAIQKNGETIGRVTLQHIDPATTLWIDLRDQHSRLPVTFKRADRLSLAVLEVPAGKLTGIAGIKAHVRGVSFGRRTF